MNQTQYDNNYHGILTHTGEVKVAKSNITTKILHISNNTILVKSKNRSYICNIHKDLKPLMKFVSVGDIAFVKWKNGNSWIVGYQKKDYDKTDYEPMGDAAVSENNNWLDFFERIDAE